MLPIQLQNKDFRFIRINMFGPNARKAALDIAWTTLNNYSYDNKIIDDYIDSGNNYGVCGGYGNLAIIDADNAIVARLVTENLPETFTVKTGGGGMHYYYIIPDFKQTCKLFDGDVHLGEIQFKGTQVIGPNSIHPNGNRYEVINDNSIAVITSQQVMDVLGKYILKYQTVKGEREFNNTNVDLTKITELRNLNQVGDELKGSHPIHGSTTGNNFSVNLTNGSWYCFRCRKGGGPMSLIAMLNRYVQCNEADKPIDVKTIKIVSMLAKLKYGLDLNS